VLALALVRCMEIIGEVATKVSAEIREAHPEVPWGRALTCPPIRSGQVNALPYTL